MAIPRKKILFSMALLTPSHILIITNAEYCPNLSKKSRTLFDIGVARFRSASLKNRLEGLSCFKDCRSLTHTQLNLQSGFTMTLRRWKPLLTMKKPGTIWEWQFVREYVNIFLFMKSTKHYFLRGEHWETRKNFKEWQSPGKAWKPIVTWKKMR